MLSLFVRKFRTYIPTFSPTNHALTAPAGLHHLIVPVLGLALVLLFPLIGYAQTIQPNFVLEGEPEELSGIANGDAVMPSTNLAGLLGQVVVRSGGSVNFAPAPSGSGVYFLNCCVNTANAYLKFPGAKVGEVFNVDSGQISFHLKSRRSFAQRQSAAASTRFIFHVRDNNPNNNVFYFTTQVSSGHLLFSYSVGAAAEFYYVPQGTEDQLFGNNIAVKVTIEWDGSTSRLYLNDSLVSSAAYAKPTPNWTATSNFNIGAIEFGTSGGYNSNDDIIDKFTVSGPPIVPDVTPPTVTLTSPSNGATVNGVITLSANASDAKGMAGVQFQLDSVNLGSLVVGSEPVYTATWDTTTATNTSHVLTATARDAAGNTSVSSVNITVANQLSAGSRIYTAATSPIYATASASSQVLGTQAHGNTGTITSGPALVNGTPWWQVNFDDPPSGWIPESLLRPLRDLTLQPNAWMRVSPEFTGMPNGGQLYPQGWANKATYDPRAHRVIFSDRWLDSVRGGSIFANGIYAYHPLTNVFEIIKLNNWWVKQLPSGGYETTPLPANSSDPTPPDHHPLTAVELVPEQNAVYTVNGVNSISLPDLSILNTTWKLDLQTRRWTKVSEASSDANYPPNNGGSPSGLVYDPVARRLVHFVPSACGCSGTATYLFDPVTARWSAVPRDPVSYNVHVAGAGVAYDAKRDRILAYGGSNYVSNVPGNGTAKLWAYSVAQNSWTQLADAPATAMAPSFAWDSKHDVFLALVGNVTYIYNPTTNSWSNYGATINRPANLQNYQSVAYDEAYDVFVFQGGSFDAPLFALFRFDPSRPPQNIDVTPPSLSITSPADQATISGTITVTANATDNVGVTGVQFKLDGANLDAIVSGSGPNYTLTWNTATAAEGTHTLSAVARDSSANTTTKTIFVTIGNLTGPPVISAVTASSVTASSAHITWTTNEPATSQVLYGTTSSYGSSSPLSSTRVRSHSIVVTGLTASTIYMYSVQSRDADGNLTSSPNLTFTTSAPEVVFDPLLRIAGDVSEVSGVTNGAIVTPTLAPSGFLGTVTTKGAGSVNFAPAHTGNGVYFQNCCDNVSPAFYKFTGSMVGNVFNINQGQVSFYLKSRLSFAARKVSATGSRFVFDVRDDNPNNHLFYFRTQVSSGALMLAYSVNGTAQFYYVPVGTEETVFGNGVVMKVTITWDGTTNRLYVNDVQVQSAAYTKPIPNWSAASNFAFGAYAYLNLGGYNTNDDLVDEFIVSGPPIVLDTTDPVVTMTSPANGSTISGAVNLSANATDNVGVSTTQFLLNGSNLGSAVTGAGPSYSRTWDTNTVANGNYTLSAKATDAAGNNATSSSFSIQVNNPLVAPVISTVATNSVTFASATITWTTNKPASSQVAFGTTTAYGSTSPLSSALTTSHSVTLTGLTASTPYHFQVLSRDVQGSLATSTNYTFTTSANPFGSPLLRIAGDVSEVSGVTNGAIVTPTLAPSGFLGTVTTKGAGSVNFAPAHTGNGVYFQNCCDNVSPAFYKFTGSMVGNVFNINQGQVSFYLKSRLSFAARKVSATGSRFVFDVRDDNPNNHLFYFRTQVSSGALMLAYSVNGTAQFYYVPVGTEETVFGNGVVMKVTITWDGTTNRLYVNDVQVQSAAYTKPIPNWSAASNFAFGAYAYLNLGGYNTNDDLVDEFIVSGPPIVLDTTDPVVTMTSPANGSTISGAVNLSANATDNVGVSTTQFLLNGSNLGSAVTGAGPSYSRTWDTNTVANGNYTLSAKATDAAGNNATSSSFSIQVNNPLVAPVISTVATNSVTFASATITWTTNKPASSQVAFGTTTAYGSTSPLSSALTTSHSVTLTGLTASTPYHFQVLSRDVQGSLATSTNYTFTTSANPFGSPLLRIAGDVSEVSGVTNGAIVTPTLAPSGFLGTVTTKGAGSVNFAPAHTGNGVYFQNCCDNVSPAFYKFTGSMVGNVFNINQGQVSFYLKSRLSFAARKVSATGSRFVFDVRDDNPNNHLFYFRTQVSSGALMLAYSVNGTAQFYYVPVGTEETVFGNGVVMKVTITWDGTTNRLYVNDVQVQSAAYTKPIPNWSAASNFAFGAYAYLNLGGYNTNDDLVDEFIVSGPN